MEESCAGERHSGLLFNLSLGRQRYLKKRRGCALDRKQLPDCEALQRRSGRFACRIKRV